MSKKIQSAHDHVFKNILGREDVARDFVRYYMPAEITSELNLDSLEVASESYISDHLQESLSDLVLTLQLKSGDPAEVYILIEHKSSLGKWTKLQLFKYMSEMWQKAAKANKERLPLIVPLVFYHGKKQWRYSLEFSDLFDLPNETYRKYIPKFEHILHEVPAVNKQKVESTITLEVFHLVLEYIFYPKKRDKIYESFALLYQGLNAEDAGEIFRVLIKYVLSATEVSPKEVEENVKHLPGGVETVRTTADVLREEGYGRGVLEGEQQGILKGECKAAQDMLFDALVEKFGTIRSSLVSRLNSIQSPDTLKMLFKQSLRLSTLEEFEEQVFKATDN
jgi:predicted transposase/invertase (TIGR01784 family)